MENENQENKPLIDDQLKEAEKQLTSIKKRIGKYNKRARHQLRFLTIIFSLVSGLIIIVTIAQGIIAWQSLNILSESTNRLDTTLQALLSKQYETFGSQDNKIDNKFEKLSLQSRKELTEFSDEMKEHIKSVLGEALKTTKLEIKYGDELLNGKVLEMNLNKGATINFPNINFINIGDKTIKSAKYIISFSGEVQANYIQETEYPPTKGYIRSATYRLDADLLEDIPYYPLIQYSFSMEESAKELQCQLKIFYEVYYQEVANFKIIHKEK